MNLSAPKQIVFFIAVVLAVVGALLSFGVFTIGGVQGFWLILGGFVVLALGNLLNGL